MTVPFSVIFTLRVSIEMVTWMISFHMKIIPGLLRFQTMEKFVYQTDLLVCLNGSAIGAPVNFQVKIFDGPAIVHSLNSK